MTATRGLSKQLEIETINQLRWGKMRIELTRRFKNELSHIVIVDRYEMRASSLKIHRRDYLIREHSLLQRELPWILWLAGRYEEKNMGHDQRRVAKVNSPSRERPLLLMAANHDAAVFFSITSCALANTYT